MAVLPGETIKIIYPPFPKAPSGVAIMPFTEFRAQGIAVSIDGTSDGPEVDALGIPTVELSVRHALTDDEQHKKRKKKQGSAIVGSNGQLRRMTWWEEWEEQETTANFHISPNESLDRRLDETCKAFRGTRFWPSTDVGLETHYQHWQLFIGMISSVSQATGKRKQKNREEDNEDGDEDDDDAFSGQKETTVEVSSNLDVIREHAAAQRTAEQQQMDDAAGEREDYSATQKNRRMEFFLFQMEKAIKIYFSAHYRSRGLLWDYTKYQNGPRLVEFFLRFLKRNHIFPEQQIRDGLDKAIPICRQALEELPRTFTVSQALPDGFAQGMKALMGDMDKTVIDWADEAAEEDADEAEPETSEETKLEEREAKKRKLDSSASVFFTSGGSDRPGAQLIGEDGDAMEVELEQRAFIETIEDNVDVGGAEAADAIPAGSVTVDDAKASVDSAADDSVWVTDGGVEINGNTNEWTQGWGDVNDDAGGAANSPWATKPENAVLHLLGPALLPYTHTTGVIEQSTRCIREIVLPSSSPPVKYANQFEAVEHSLATKLGYIVLGPWNKVGNHCQSDVLSPRLNWQSRGSVVSQGDGANTPPGAFDPAKDEIRVLLDPETLAKLAGSVGMGLTATWVQIARKDKPSDTPGPEIENSFDAWNTKPKKGKKKAPTIGGPGNYGAPTQWWYMESLCSTLTSFHTDMYYPNQA